MHLMRMLGDDLRLVRLEVTDEVPLDVELRQSLRLGRELLGVAFAERPLARRVGLANGIRRLRLRDGHELDVRRVAARPNRSLRDPLANGREAALDAHARLRAVCHTITSLLAVSGAPAKSPSARTTSNPL